MSNITVLSVSADASFYGYLQTTLAHHDGISLFGSVWDNDAHLMSIVQDMKPDVLVMDGQFLGEGEVRRLLRIHAASPNTKTILLYELCRRHEMLEAIGHGAKGCISKASSPEQWLKAIHVIHAGDIWIDRKMLTEAMNGLLQHHLSKFHAMELKPEILTEREWEVVRWVGYGMTNKEIARQMAISDTTVKTHLQNIFGKLKVGRRLQLPLA